MWLKWLPWKFVIRSAARAGGFVDPVAVLAQLHRFAQPSEVAEPIELLRAGVVFHARGLINSRVIQHNLDWVWPYWAERQFDPSDPSFVPRAFSITHVNLTHRNWTAIGLPDCTDMPIVDPRGLVTPHFDAWSLDGWIVTENGRTLLPSRAAVADQRLDCETGLAVTTKIEDSGLALASHAEVVMESGVPVCRAGLSAQADADGWAVVALRPYNAEGISFIHDLSLAADRRSWTIDGRHVVQFDAAVDRHHVSNYRGGDVHIHLRDLEDEEAGTCDVGLLTAAALFRLRAGEEREIVARVPLDDAPSPPSHTWPGWVGGLEGHCALQLPDRKTQDLYDIALKTLVLHSPGEVYPGPYTYKRFWFRDAAFILQAMLCSGLIDRVERALRRFPDRQTATGYFRSQNGEWDSNGEALWIMHRFCRLTGQPPDPSWRRSIRRGGRWIMRKRLADAPASPHAGLFPAGFSAEHLGPNDYYYWDDFWGVAGLRAAAELMTMSGDEASAVEFRAAAEDFLRATEQSLAGVADRLGRPAMPASPYRRLDAGAIGSIAMGYPLLLCPPDDPRLLDTVDFLLDRCFVRDGFFQDMIHSGINAYLTLQVAQVLLRAGDPRWFDLLSAVTELASPTGQWPEAIHPHTGGGCMGDGQHVWAAAEWVLMIRNCFVREEGDGLVLASGIPRQWLDAGTPLGLGPTPTPFGPLSISIARDKDRIEVTWQGDWRDGPPPIVVRIGGCAAVRARPGETSAELRLEPAS